MVMLSMSVRVVSASTRLCYSSDSTAEIQGGDLDISLVYPVRGLDKAEGAVELGTLSGEGVITCLCQWRTEEVSFSMLSLCIACFSLSTAVHHPSIRIQVGKSIE